MFFFLCYFCFQISDLKICFFDNQMFPPTLVTYVFTEKIFLKNFWKIAPYFDLIILMVHKVI